MRTASAPPPLKPHDIKYIVARLARETGVGEAEAQLAYIEAGHIYKQAEKAIQRAKQADEERRAEWARWQRILVLLYRTRILPAMRTAYDITLPNFDPLTDVGDAMRLHRELTDRDITAYPKKVQGIYIWHVSDGKGKVGQGVSDVYQEGLVIAWWVAFGEDK